MEPRTEVEWWKEGLSPENTIKAWSAAATTTVIITVLMEERLAKDGKIVIDGKTIATLEDKE